MITAIMSSEVSVNIAAIKAAKGCKVLIVAAERDQVVARWAARRALMGFEGGSIDENSVEIDVLRGYGNLSLLVEYAVTEYDHVLVNATDVDSSALLLAADFADVILAPVQPGNSDFRTLVALNQIAKDRATPGYPSLEVVAFVNRVCLDHGRDHELNQLLFDAIDLFSHVDVSVVIHESAAFEKSLHTGLGVHELPENDYDETACSELAALADMILSAGEYMQNSFQEAVTWHTWPE